MQVPPNQFFDVDENKFVRYFPNHDHEILNKTRIIREVSSNLKDQLKVLSKRYSLKIGISGGLDSRLTLAASKQTADANSYFTYHSRNEVLQNDKSVVEKLIEYIDINHQFHEAYQGNANESLREKWDISNDLPRPLGINSLFCEIFRREDLHIRSNVLEIARGFYTKNTVNQKNSFDGRKLSRLYKRALSDDSIGPFEEFISLTNFNSQSLRGYHYSDIFYWEHRLGSWLGPMISFNRFSCDTFILYNCRRILTLLLSQSIETRNNAYLILELIRNLWPEVLNVPIYSGSRYITTNK